LTEDVVNLCSGDGLSVRWEKLRQIGPESSYPQDPVYPQTYNQRVTKSKPTKDDDLPIGGRIHPHPAAKFFPSNPIGSDVDFDTKNRRFRRGRTRFLRPGSHKEVYSEVNMVVAGEVAAGFFLKKGFVRWVIRTLVEIRIRITLIR
jgi:hypothetical protein